MSAAQLTSDRDLSKAGVAAAGCRSLGARTGLKRLSSVVRFGVDTIRVTSMTTEEQLQCYMYL